MSSLTVRHTAAQKAAGRYQVGDIEGAIKALAEVDQTFADQIKIFHLGMPGTILLDWTSPSGTMVN